MSATDFGGCLLIGVVQAIDFGDFLLLIIGVVQTPDFRDCLLIGMAKAKDFGDHLLAGMV